MVWKKLTASASGARSPSTACGPLHLTVEEGEIFGFLGPNGAGKTTTLKLLMGLIFPTAGTARILGMEINDPRMKAQIGFLPEQPYFYDYLTARELLEYYGQLSGVDPQTAIAQSRMKSCSAWGCPMSAECSCASFPKACCSAWGSRRPFCTTRKSFSLTNRCPAWIPWAAVKFATSWSS